MATSFQIPRPARATEVVPLHKAPLPLSGFVDSTGDVWVPSGYTDKGELLLSCPQPQETRDAGEGDSHPWTLHDVQSAFGPLIARTATPPAMFDPRLPARFWDKVRRVPSGCWEWTASLDRYGYSKYSEQGRDLKGHRVAYIGLRGPLADGTQLDHLRRNRACVNPAHLEPVTQAENARRSAPAQKTHCANGHEFTPENTYLRPKGGRRDCRACIRDRVRRYQSKGRAA
jgi:hypothetical protein